ncbi:MAG TPA: sigma-70 family RNA polymerase sigma factor, partial [Planctomycetota bacterium]|nr:sigma-70 family RNA polymerase sigma factor [Planctomycetota bacterium]
MLADQRILQDYISTRDGEAFAELVRRHAGMVFGTCRRVLGDRSLAEDAAQETFLHLLRHPAEVTGSLVGWLHKVAHGKAVDLVRREAAHGRRKQQAIVPPPEPERPWAEISPILDQVLAELPPETREVLVGHYLQGANQADLATQLGVSQPTISRRLQAGLAAMKEKLAARGVVHSVAALALVLDQSALTPVPATLASELGKMALAGHVGVGGAVVTGGTVAVTGTTGLMVKIALVAAVAGGGAVATVQAMRTAPTAPIIGQEVPAWRRVSADDGGLSPAKAPAAPADVIDAQGPLVLVAASTFGGGGDDAVVGVGIAQDHTILVAANVIEPQLAAETKRTLIGPAGTKQDAPPPPADPKQKPPPHPSTRGMIARLSSDGRTLQGVTAFGYGQARIERLLVDEQGAVVVLGENVAGADLGGGPGKGRFIAKFDPTAQKLRWILYREGISDFAFDGNGDLVVLAMNKLVRFDSASGAEKWTAMWKTWGENRPGGMSVDPFSGIVTVVGYGMTKTGHEPYKDPFAYGFDRDGKQAWMLWNPDPTREVDAKFGGNGLMADTTGRAAGVTADGKFLLTLYADGGNTVCNRDPADPDKPLDPAVFKDVHQNGPGYGFKGASKTSVVFRVDAKTGALEKGTWFCAWLNPQHANGLGIDALSGTNGMHLLVGSSANGLPLKQPWYAHVEGAYQGGGFLAVFDGGFRLQQCGYFCGSSL